MTLTITITTDNAAFDPYPGQELSRLLRKAADEVVTWTGPETFALQDYNGNRCGMVALKEVQS